MRNDSNEFRLILKHCSTTGKDPILYVISGGLSFRLNLNLFCRAVIIVDHCL